MRISCFKLLNGIKTNITTPPSGTPDVHSHDYAHGSYFVLFISPSINFYPYYCEFFIQWIEAENMDLWIKWIPQDNLDLKHDKLQQFRLCIW